jgi:hypothetical protein
MASKPAKETKPLTIGASNDGSRTVVFSVDHGEWVVTCAFVQQQGQPALASLYVAPRGDVPAGGLPARLLRTIRPGDLLVEARRRLAESVSTPAGDLASFVDQAPRSGRRRRMSDIASAVLAWRYVQACATSKKPILKLAEELKMDRDQVRGAVNDLRRRDFLTPGEPGRAGASLTEKTKAILAELSAGVLATSTNDPDRLLPRTSRTD